MPLFDIVSGPLFLAIAAIAVAAGVVKGMVGFAMPMIMIAGMGSLVAPELALAGLILPTLITNLWQALGQGVGAAWRDARRFGLFMGVGAVCLVAAAQVVPYLDVGAFYTALGVPVVLFSLAQLVGWRPHVDPARPARAQGVAGLVAGVMGGLSGVWGPPTVMLLTALETPKEVQMRVQGVVYGMGAILLVAAHLRTGILTVQTALFSGLLVVPAGLGMWLGSRLQSRIDQNSFRRLTLIVLLVAGANLIRRGIMG